MQTLSTDASQLACSKGKLIVKLQTTIHERGNYKFYDLHEHDRKKQTTVSNTFESEGHFYSIHSEETELVVSGTEHRETRRSVMRTVVWNVQYGTITYHTNIRLCVNSKQKGGLGLWVLALNTPGNIVIKTSTATTPKKYWINVLFIMILQMLTQS